MNRAMLRAETLAWGAEPSVGTYNLYRDLMSDLSGLGYGDCEQQEIADPTTTDTTRGKQEIDKARPKVTNCQPGR